MLNSAEQQLLDAHLKDLQRALKPGEKRLNWNSLGIQDYIVKCEQVRLLYAQLLAFHCNKRGRAFLLV